jgi:hypothetical protein
MAGQILSESFFVQDTYGLRLRLRGGSERDSISAVFGCSAQSGYLPRESCRCHPCALGVVPKRSTPSLSYPRIPASEPAPSPKSDGWRVPTSCRVVGTNPVSILAAVLTSIPFRVCVILGGCASARHPPPLHHCLRCPESTPFSRRPAAGQE